MADKSIIQKLSVKPGTRFLVVNPPAGYIQALGKPPEGVTLLSDSSCQVEAIQVFVSNKAELEEKLPELKDLLAAKGMLWVTYHKGTSKVKTDINRDSINAYAQTLGLQGVAMISIDDNWSALRLKLA
ncbi:MAG: hypothetical protein C3F13_19105 [Anaerolineales bacterium]|nr:DUF3052 family protein [Anaerolineae bacterium]PWB49509.1 MAG: hypothetical protein C3F13_19105 [Anaerolineales bacterium]